MYTRLHFVLMFLCSLLCVVSLGVQAQADFIVGHVVNFDGTWIDKKCKCKIDQGHAIWSNSVVGRQRPYKTNSRIVIRFAATGRPETFDCTKIDCADPLDILARIPKNESSSRVGIFLRAALNVVEDNLPGTATRSRTVSGYVRAYSGRGVESIPISDAIVPLRGGRPDLSAVFERVGAGSYLIEFCLIAKTGKHVCPEVPEVGEFEWKADGKEALSSRALQPSLYELFLCRRQGNRVFRSESAFVLVAGNEQTTQQMSAKHQEFLKLMEGWTPKEVSMLQHAYLQHLNLTENR